MTKFEFSLAVLTSMTVLNFNSVRSRFCISTKGVASINISLQQIKCEVFTMLAAYENYAIFAKLMSTGF